MELAQDNSAPEQDVPQSANPTSIKAMQSLKKQYFSPEQTDQASQAINNAVEIVNAANGSVVFNFNPETDDIPENYAIIVAPINQRNQATGKTDTVGVSIGAIPTETLLQQSKEGQAFCSEVIQNAITAKLANSVRPTKSGEISASIPYTVADFITSNRAEGLLVAYRKLAPAYIKALKGMGFKNLTDATFRSTLTSSAFALATFPKIPQDKWVGIISKMISLAEKEGMIAGMLSEWLTTRDNAGMPEAEEIDLTDFEGLF